ncbi:hypothetical protein [Streptomyces showdoensis]|uniref:Uncharacterized protein n=1 Tax=Streptomyces showdoensis TaxID=68268 RepID=A0A2P2GT51_STREW|nr:hypothetical protein [Streptomyces showdoensis]KKZ74666.1 hypothetical protein VO63_06160 [Streptomyces showdoensis]
MGIENDRLVFDYLSRVGDLAQQRRMPSAERRELVTGLRDEIERRRTVKGEPVRGILGDLGTPDEVVDGTRRVPGPRPDTDTEAEAEAVPAPREPDWWRADATGAGGDVVDAMDVPAALGFHGGVEIPELLEPPDAEDDADDDAATAEDADEEAVPEERGAALRRRLSFRLGSPLLLVSAALLLTGAAGGWLLPLAAGWVLTYFSRERRAAALTLPGLAVTAGAVWLWGRVGGRWGDPVAPGGEALGAALSDTWPWTLRAAAIASGLYLLWRSRRG